MKSRPLTLAALALLGLLATATLPAQAAHVGVHFGIGVPWPGYYYPPAYPYAYSPYYGGYYGGYPGYVAPAPAPVIVQTPPATYVERAPVAQAGEQGNWYYCEKEKGYYPYVKQCPGGWMQVPARPQQ